MLHNGKEVMLENCEDAGDDKDRICIVKLHEEDVYATLKMEHACRYSLVETRIVYTNPTLDARGPSLPRADSTSQSGMVWIHLNRFDSEGQKIKTSVDMPDVMPDVIGEGENNPFAGWQLRAFSNHKGETIGSGHYETYVKHNNTTWYRCTNSAPNDRVTNVNGKTRKNMQQKAQKTGYTYLYTHPNMPWNTDPPTPLKGIGATSHTCYAAGLLQMLRTLPRDYFSDGWKGVIDDKNSKAFWKKAFDLIEENRKKIEQDIAKIMEENEGGSFASLREGGSMTMIGAGGSVSLF